MTEKIAVNGAATHPLFAWLKRENPGLLGGAIKWNFTKFLVGRNGAVIERSAPTTALFGVVIVPLLAVLAKTERKLASGTSLADIVPAALVGVASEAVASAVESSFPLMRPLYFDHPTDTMVWEHPLSGGCVVTVDVSERTAVPLFVRADVWSVLGPVLAAG